jgi:imidazolonepropionase-like amidohydrolase
MKRREFIKYCISSGALTLISATESGCVELSPRLKPAELKPSSTNTILLKNLRLVDVENGRILYPAHIIIKGKIIEDVITGNDIPRCDITLDLNDRYVIPGLINAHCHLTLPGTFGLRLKFLISLKRQIERNAEECLRHGITTVRDMLGFPSALENLIKDINAGKLLGPRILRNTAIQVKGGYLEPLSILGGNRMIMGIHSPEEARRAVKIACHNYNPDFIKTFLQYQELWLPGNPLPVLSDDMLLAIRDEAEKHGKPVALHHTSVEGLRRALKAGIHSLEHMAVDNLLTDEDINLILKSNAGIIPTASVAWALAFRRNGDPFSDSTEVTEIIEDRLQHIELYLEEFAENPVKEIAMDAMRKFSNPNYFDSNHIMLTPEPKIFNSAAVIGNRNLMRIANAGALIGCGNDGGIPFLFPGMMALEMGILQRQGLKAIEILRMATINNAKILRLDDRLGSIKKGKIADIVVLSANPLEDVKNIARIEKVFLEGDLKYSL